jgi:hypothetical protein
MDGEDNNHQACEFQQLPLWLCGLYPCCRPLEAGSCGRSREQGLATRKCTVKRGRIPEWRPHTVLGTCVL